MNTAQIVISFTYIAGLGHAQVWGGPIEEIRPCDVI
jgi:hypothetical protein